MVSAPIEADARLFHRQPLGKRPAARVELMANHADAVAAFRKRARQAQDQPLRTREQLELREYEINSHGS